MISHLQKFKFHNISCVNSPSQPPLSLSANSLLKASGPFVQTFCIEKDSYMDAI